MSGKIIIDGVTVDDALFLNEQPSAQADIAGKGQLWVKNATPNELWFTNDAGTDVQLGTEGGFVDRGDPSSADWTETTLTTDDTWNDLDCSGIVPIGAKAILFKSYIKSNTASSRLSMRKNGNSNSWACQGAHVQVADVGIDGNMVVPCDSNRVVEYIATDIAWTSIDLTVVGWWI